MLKVISVMLAVLYGAAFITGYLVQQLMGVCV